MTLIHLVVRGWATLVQAVRRGLQATGILTQLDNWAARSRIGLWVRSLFSLYDVSDFIRLDVPWWTLDSMSLVDEFLAARPNARVFEWGSGASTMWLDKRAGEVISVEYDPEWETMMRPLIGPHTQIVHIPARPSSAPEVGSRMWGHKHLDYRDYVDAIDRFNGEFDLIVIDGRARSACLDKATKRLAPQGMIVFDNTNRSRYQPALKSVSSHLEGTVTTGLTPLLPWPTETTLLRRTGS